MYDIIDIHALALSHIEYENASSKRQKIEIIKKGVEEALLKLHRYTKSRDLFIEKYEFALNEINNVLNRFYYADDEFKKLVNKYVKDFIMSLSNKIK